MSCRDDDDIGSSRDLREMFSRAIATCHRCSGIHEHEGHRLADDIRSTDDTDVFPLHVDIVVREESHDALRSTAPESIMSEEHIADLCAGESIDILRWGDTFGDGIAVNMGGKGRLHDDAVDLLIR